MRQERAGSAAEPAVTAAVGGVVQITQAGYSARDLIDSGRLKILVVAGPKRFAAFPNVLTTADVGYPKVDSSSWLMMAAPIKTPVSTLAKIDDDLSRVLHDSSVLTQLVEARGLITSDIRQSDAADQLNRQSRDRAEAVQKAGLDKQ
jgi:tripartite-type tricarboxylate transporter receptor subunit TctC